MIRTAELAVFAVPVLAFLLWRAAVRQGLAGPPPRQLVGILVVLAALGTGLAWFAVHEGLPPGPYVPASLQDGRVVPGHAG